MKSKIVLFFTIILSFLLQSTLLQKIAIGSITPNLLLILCVSMGLMRGRKSGLWTGFFSGLLVDLFYGSVFGFYALIYMYAGFFSGYAFRIMMMISKFQWLSLQSWICSIIWQCMDFSFS